MSNEKLAGSRILIVEDEYYLADDARSLLSAAGAEVLGPVPTIAAASALIEAEPTIDCVLLDVNLRGEFAFDMADDLDRRAIPYVLVTGYDRSALPDRFTDKPTLRKPVAPNALLAAFREIETI